MTGAVASTWIFDCDGVLLDSNWLKSEAFRRVALPYGESAAEQLVAHHTAHGGVSRFQKIEHLHTTILRGEANGALDADIARFGVIVEDLLAEVTVTDGCIELLDALSDTGRPCHVVSGGLEREVRDVLGAVGIAKYFTGINGSPASKHEIFSALGIAGALKDAVYLGDSRYDHEVARDFGVPFVFVSGWSELADWPTYVETHDLRCVRSLAELVPAITGSVAR